MGTVLKKLVIFIVIAMSIQTSVIYDFSNENQIEKWQIVNDGVMGGLSSSKISLTENGHGKFSGHVSLENNGGFASVRLMTTIEMKPNDNHILLKIKGDGKTYQFRLKADQNQSQSYVQFFETNGDWQTVRLDLKDFYPQYRGRKLDMPNFNFSKVEEIRFLITNKKEQDFELLIDSIELE